MSFNPEMKILVVDDMKTMRSIIKRALAKIGCTNIQEADDGLPAWRILEESKKLSTDHHFDFIISDWNMPTTTGMELLTKVRADDVYGRIPFMMVTAEGEQKNVMSAIKGGVNGFVVKPFDAEDFNAKVKKILN